MQVIVDDARGKLSKTQREKLKAAVRRAYESSDETESLLKQAFGSIFYKEGDEPYADMRTSREETTVRVSFVDREELRQRLRASIRSGSGSRDKRWQMYQRIKPHVKMPLPTPTEIQDNRAMFEGLLRGMGENNPVGQYFATCLNWKKQSSR